MIEVENLSKRFGSHSAVEDISFTCEPGTVTGFLGPNGAGKTTSMRMIAGLARPSSGRALVLGEEFRRISNPALHVGILLDASAQHSGRTGREALTITARTIGVPDSRVEELLKLVGLDETAAKRRVGKYSLGMRQRLGLALVLLGDPRVLILDEPANGLDPQGIIWMRNLLRDFADRGGTVLLSSHLLHEVDAIADRLLLVNKGKLVAAGPKAELLAGSGTFVRGSDLAALDRALVAAGIETSPSGEGGLLVSAEGERIGPIALDARVALTEIRPADGGGLEELFLSLTAGSGQDDADDTTINQEVAA